MNPNRFRNLNELERALDSDDTDGSYDLDGTDDFSFDLGNSDFASWPDSRQRRRERYIRRKSRPRR